MKKFKLCLFSLILILSSLGVAQIQKNKSYASCMKSNIYEDESTKNSTKTAKLFFNGCAGFTDKYEVIFEITERFNYIRFFIYDKKQNSNVFFKRITTRPFNSSTPSKPKLEITFFFPKEKLPPGIYDFIIYGSGYKNGDFELIKRFEDIEIDEEFNCIDNQNVISPDDEKSKRDDKDLIYFDYIEEKEKRKKP